ncbi:saccharopine dehydrogenase family protein [Cryptosporangium phraense]|uniref:Saccharopine dehydrogenase n=1 Tax=Cryptosporangium phraense TaxID=2593070 RepID=A0A545AFV2_9ACTN|nr:saccharopine dehydrogenase NADP-binding domain-containing protein [Cryptosporangium phraense]TQS40222.1 saccharopine dehydrogenase [Cryptosporangium phraense]
MVRPYDLVLFGATGFTGGLTAEYLAGHAPPGLRWALAGRNAAKLAAVRDRLESAPDVLHADATDARSVREVAESTRVVASTVGPYVKFGEPLVAACAESGTHYTDLTGEPRFVDEMYLRHHDTAVGSGAKLVHACGFDSIPADLGAYFTVQHLPEGVPLQVESFYRVAGQASAGTVHSLIGAVADALPARRAHRERRRREGTPDGRRIGFTGPLPRTHPLGPWTVPLPTLDPQIVARSAAALDRYGPEFRYGQYAVMPSPAAAAAAVVGAGAVAAAAQIRPVRNGILRRFPSGSGPTPEQREAGWMSVRCTGVGGGQGVLTEVYSDRDPGYASTAIMLGEATLSLALDDLPPAAGQLTTAVAMGDALIARLDAAGITFRVLGRRTLPS